jgi:hypothetical protein
MGPSSPTLREEIRLRMLENIVLRRIFGPWERTSQEDGENYIMRIIVICILHQILLG